MIKPIQGIFFRDINNDYVAHIIKEIWFDKVYEPFIQGKENLKVVDIGANVGLFTYYIAPKSSVVVSVEPSLQHFETLSQMVEFNHLTNVETINAAVGNENKTAQFYHNQNTTMFSLKKEIDGLPEEAESVLVVDLETLLKDVQLDEVDLLKLDVEGSEMDIVTSKGFANCANKIKLVIGEFHTWSGVNPAQFANVFKDLGFDFQWLGVTEASMFVAERRA